MVEIVSNLEEKLSSLKLEEVQGESTLNLSVLLNSTVFWKPLKSLGFFMSVHNFIKESKQCDNVAINLKSALESEENGLKWSLWQSFTNWRDLLGDAHFDTVSTRFTIDKKTQTVNKVKVKKVNTKSVLELLAIIRNKYEHNALFDNAQKEELGWFRKVNGEWQFDTELYSKYWTSRFPNLEYFLWVKCWELKNVPNFQNEFYPGNPDCIAPDWKYFVDELLNSLKTHTETGSLKWRYNLGGSQETEGRSIEFRTLESFLLTKVLNGSSLTIAKISCETVNITWYQSSKTGSNEVKVEKSIPLGSALSTINTILFIAKTYSDVDVQNVISDMKVFQNCKIIVFSNCTETSSFEQVNQVKLIVEKLASFLKVEYFENPMCWDDLSAKSQKLLENTSEFNIQGNCKKRVSLNSILISHPLFYNELLLTLGGTTLNQLLTKQTPSLFELANIPPKPLHYIKRCLRKAIEVKLQVLKVRTESDIFVVTNISLEKLVNLTNIRAKNILVVKSYNFPATVQHKIYLLETEWLDPERIFVMLEQRNSSGEPKNIHCLKYFHGSLAHLIETKGSSAVLSKFSSDNAYKTEDQLLQHVDSTWSDERLVLIADMPGMGKSLTLANFARKLYSSNGNCIMVYKTVSDFVTKLRKTKIKNALMELLCQSNFEKQLLKQLLHQECSTKKSLHLELMLDGLDEVNQEDRDLVVSSIKSVENLYSLRIWITMRNPVYEARGSGMKVSCYKFEPFSLDNQITFLEQYWRSLLGESKKPPGSKVLRKFAQQCVKIPLPQGDTNIAGIPLQCQMIAEIYESQVLSQDFSPPKCLMLVDLFEGMVERKLEVFAKQKKGFPDSLQKDDYIYNTLRERMFLSHAYFAVKLVLGESIANTFKNRLLITQNYHNNLASDVMDQGIIAKTSPPEFIHRTFAEYFVALFIYQVLSGNLFTILEMDPDFQNFLWNEFLQISFTSEPEGYIQCRGDYCAVYHFLNAIEGRHCKPPKWLPSQWKSITPRVVMAIASGKIRVDELSKRCGNFYLCVGLGYKCVCALLLKSEQCTRGLFLSFLISQEYSLCYAIMEGVNDFKPQNLGWLKDVDENQYGILHWLFYGLCQCTRSMLPDFKQTYAIIDYIVNEDGSALEHRDKQGRTPFLYLVQQSSSTGFFVHLTWYTELFRYMLYRWNVNIKAVDNHGNTIMHITDSIYKAREGRQRNELFRAHILFWFLMCLRWEVRDIINYQNNYGYTPLASLISENLEQNLNQRYEWSYFAIEISKGYRVNFNLKDEAGNTVLHLAILKGCEERVTQLLIQAGANELDVNKQGQCLLHVAVEAENFEIVKMCLKRYPSFLKAKDGNKKTALEYPMSKRLDKFIRFHLKNALHLRRT